MFAKMAFLLLAITCIAAGLLVLRQQRMQLAHEMALAHRQIDAHRQNLWNLQVAVAQKVQPDALRQAVARANLQLEPIAPVRQPAPMPAPARTLQVATRTGSARGRN